MWHQCVGAVVGARAATTWLTSALSSHVRLPLPLLPPPPPQQQRTCCTVPHSHAKWSFARVDETTGFVTEVAEKRVISNAATRAADSTDCRTRCQCNMIRSIQRRGLPRWQRFGANCRHRGATQHAVGAHLRGGWIDTAALGNGAVFLEEQRCVRKVRCHGPQPHARLRSMQWGSPRAGTPTR